MAGFPPIAPFFGKSPVAARPSRMTKPALPGKPFMPARQAESSPSLPAGRGVWDYLLYGATGVGAFLAARLGYTTFAPHVGKWAGNLPPLPLPSAPPAPPPARRLYDGALSLLNRGMKGVAILGGSGLTAFGISALFRKGERTIPPEGIRTPSQPASPLISPVSSDGTNTPLLQTDEFVTPIQIVSANEEIVASPLTESSSTFSNANSIPLEEQPKASPLPSQRKDSSSSLDFSEPLYNRFNRSVSIEEVDDIDTPPSHSNSNYSTYSAASTGPINPLDDLDNEDNPPIVLVSNLSNSSTSPSTSSEASSNLPSSASQTQESNSDSIQKRNVEEQASISSPPEQSQPQSVNTPPTNLGRVKEYKHDLGYWEYDSGAKWYPYTGEVVFPTTDSSSSTSTASSASSTTSLPRAQQGNQSTISAETLEKLQKIPIYSVWRGISFQKPYGELSERNNQEDFALSQAVLETWGWQVIPKGAVWMPDKCWQINNMRYFPGSREPVPTNIPLPDPSTYSKKPDFPENFNTYNTILAEIMGDNFPKLHQLTRAGDMKKAVKACKEFLRGNHPDKNRGNKYLEEKCKKVTRLLEALQDSSELEELKNKLSEIKTQPSEASYSGRSSHSSRNSSASGVSRSSFSNKSSGIFNFNHSQPIDYMQLSNGNCILRQGNREQEIGGTFGLQDLRVLQGLIINVYRKSRGSELYQWTAGNNYVQGPRGHMQLPSQLENLLHPGPVHDWLLKQPGVTS
jgi:hypothetical protein